MPAVNDAACQRINPHWIRLEAAFFPVLPTITVADIEAFAHTQVLPAGTEAVGLFAGACMLAEDPFRPLALIINYCGPVPPTVPVAAAAATTGAAPGAATAAAAVDEEPVAPDGGSDTAEVLEAEAAEVMKTALGF